MKLPRFTYHRPETADEALTLLNDHGPDAKVLAGGQSLLPLLALRMAHPESVVDIGRVTEFDQLDVDQAGHALVVGAGVRHATLEFSPLVRSIAPLIAAAMPHVGHRAIRTRGTMCGSLAHGDPAAELPAVALAVGAEMVARSRRGERLVAADDFFVGYLTTALEDDELLVAVRVPSWPERAGWSVQEVSRRHGDFAVVGLAAMVEMDQEGAIERAALSFFGVGSQPQRVPAAEQLLIGHRPTAALFEEAARVVSGALDPPGDLHGSSAYRAHVAGVLTRKGLAEAVARTGVAA